MIYLDNAATTRLKPQCVINSMVEELQNSANCGRAAHSAAIRAAEIVYKCRSKLGDAFCVPSDNVIFTPGCTYSLNYAINCFIPRGHIITTCAEHNSVLRPLFNLKNQGKIRLSVVCGNKGHITCDDILKEINSDTTMICVAQTTNVTGDTIDIEQLSKETASKGISLIIDTAQSFGHLDLDVSKHAIDFVCGAGHKGINGPQGIGFLICNTKRKCKPMILGGTGTYSSSVIQPADIPEGFESGTLNTPAIAGLMSAIDWTYSNRIEIENNIHTLTTQLINGLKGIHNVQLYSNNANGVISFNIKNTDCSKISDILSSEYDIAVRSGYHCAPLIHGQIGSTANNGTVRASIGAINTSKDIQVLLKAIKNIASNVI